LLDFSMHSEQQTDGPTNLQSTCPAGISRSVLPCSIDRSARLPPHLSLWSACLPASLRFCCSADMLDGLKQSTTNKMHKRSSRLFSLPPDKRPTVGRLPCTEQNRKEGRKEGEGKKRTPLEGLKEVEQTAKKKGRQRSRKQLI